MLVQEMAGPRPWERRVLTTIQKLWLAGSTKAKTRLIRPTQRLTLRFRGACTRDFACVIPPALDSRTILRYDLGSTSVAASSAASRKIQPLARPGKIGLGCCERLRSRQRRQGHSVQSSRNLEGPPCSVYPERSPFLANCRGRPESQQLEETQQCPGRVLAVGELDLDFLSSLGGAGPPRSLVGDPVFFPDGPHPERFVRQREIARWVCKVRIDLDHTAGRERAEPPPAAARGRRDRLTDTLLPLQRP